MPDSHNRSSRNASGDLYGKTAVVTGSSSGIGQAIALELASAGADVFVHAGSSQEAAENVAQAVRAMGCQSQVYLCDLADSENHAKLVEKAWTWQEGVDIWINNAGADVLTGAAAQWSYDQKLAHLLKVDVTATIRLSRLIGQRMTESSNSSEAGVILNMGWDQADHGMEGESGEMFAAAKGAIMAFSKSLAISLAPQVRVNCLAPGWIKTRWGRQASSDWQRRAIGQSLMQRWGTPEDVARVARFLVSPQAGFLTGQVVPVNGGLRRGP